MRIENIEDLKGEIWIKTSSYEISNKGRIITKQGLLFTGNITKHGYVSAHVEFDDGFIARSAHRAVAHVFIPNPLDLPEVNHKDGNKLNNCVENLEWVTKKENQYHATYVLGKRLGEDCTRSFLTEEKVIEIYNLCKEGEMKYKDIAKLYGIFPQEVTDIALCTYWKGLNLEPLPKLTRGSRSRGKKIIWLNEDKKYNSMKKCSEDLRNTYNIIVTTNRIKDICEGKLKEWKGQNFKFAS